MIFAWLRQLKQTFGVPFLLLVVSVYWTQGFRAFPWTGISYLMKDELKLSPSASQLLTSTAFIPWSIKPVYGVFSDCVYIYGNRRIPYLLLASVLSIIAWAILAFSPGVLQSTTLFTTLLICQNLGSAMADVVVDAMVAETAKREREEFAGDLQTLSWFAMALGGVSGSLSGGPGLKALKPSGMFAVFTLFPVLQFFTCFLLDEKSLLAGPASQPPAAQPPSIKAEVEIAESAGGVVLREKTGGESSLALTQTSLSHGEDAIRTRKGRRGKGGGSKSGFGNGNGWHGEAAVEHVFVVDAEETDRRDGERDGMGDGGWETSGRPDKVASKASSGGSGGGGGSAADVQPRRQSYGSRFTFLDSSGDMEGDRSDSLAGDGGNVESGERQNGQNGENRQNGEKGEKGEKGEEKRRSEGGGGSATPVVKNGEEWVGRGGSGRRKGVQKKRKWSLTESGAEGSREGRAHSITKELKNVSKALWEAVRRPAIVRPLLWFMISVASVPSLQTIMFYFHTNALHLDPAFLGTARVAGWGGLMVGTLLYSAFLKHVPLRRIFLGVHALMALVTLGDAMLVSRLNLRMGLPDKLFVLISAALFDAVNQFRFMPFLILSARLCPPGVEGTLFAVFMSAYNLGGTISGYLGATLATSLGVTAHSFVELGTGIRIQAACTLLPVLFLGMIPAGATGVSEHDQAAKPKPKQKKRH